MRIASLAPSVTTILQELGVASSIVACTHICPLPVAQRQQLAVGSFSALDEDRLAAVRPDIVFTATLVQAGGQARLREQGFRVVHLDPRRLVDVGEQYRIIAQQVGVAERGEALGRAFLTDLAVMRTSEVPRCRVYMEEWATPPFVAGNWVPDMVRLVGGEPVLSYSGEPSRAISREEIQQSDPDLIVQHVCLSPGHDWRALRLKLVDDLSRRPGWEGLRAVQSGRVYGVDDSLFNMPTRQLLAGVRLLRSLILRAMK